MDRQPLLGGRHGHTDSGINCGLVSGVAVIAIGLITSYSDGLKTGAYISIIGTYSH